MPRRRQMNLSAALFRRDDISCCINAHYRRHDTEVVFIVYIKLYNFISHKSHYHAEILVGLYYKIHRPASAALKCRSVERVRCHERARGLSCDVPRAQPIGSAGMMVVRAAAILSPEHGRNRKQRRLPRARAAPIWLYGIIASASSFIPAGRLISKF